MMINLAKEDPIKCIQSFKSGSQSQGYKDIMLENVVVMLPELQWNDTSKEDVRFVAKEGTWELYKAHRLMRSRISPMVTHEDKID